MREQRIVLTDSDMIRLRKLIESAKRFLARDRHHAEALEEKVMGAEIVSEYQISPKVVRMNSHVWIKDLDTGTRQGYVLVFPNSADIADNKISVLAPLGTAILGCRVGDKIEWDAPGGIRRIELQDVQHQPRGVRTAA